MVANLHGGGLRLTSVQGIDEIASDIKRGAWPSSLDYEFSTIEGPVKDAVLTLSPGEAGARWGFLPSLNAEAQRYLRTLSDSQSESTSDFQSIFSSTNEYMRLVPNVACEDIAPRTVLQRLAWAMNNAQPAAMDSGIPVQYTYLGQFIAHDMSYMRFDQGFETPRNLRTHELDLDSLFGSIAGNCYVPDEAKSVGGITVGPTFGVPHRHCDLPRSWFGSNRGRPCIPDLRNDNNLSVAQMTVAIMKFHQAVTSFCATMGETAPDIEVITRRHFQSVVLDDFLEKIIDPRIYSDVYSPGNKNNRRVIFPGINLEGLDVFQVPVEFAGACFRFGHSLVKQEYKWNEILAYNSLNLNQLLNETHLGLRIRQEPRLLDSWVVDWSIFRQQQNSNAIDCTIASDLRELGSQWVDDPVHSEATRHHLAELTLLRGHSLRLPTAQMLLCYLKTRLQPDEPEISEFLLPHEIVDENDNCVGPHLSESDRTTIQQKTPLWFYILREAEVRAGGRHLGPIGSRIVMETIHAAIAAVDDNIITGAPFSLDQRLLNRPGTEFPFADLLATVKRFDPDHTP